MISLALRIQTPMQPHPPPSSAAPREQRHREQPHSLQGVQQTQPLTRANSQQGLSLQPLTGTNSRHGDRLGAPRPPHPTNLADSLQATRKTTQPVTLTNEINEIGRRSKTNRPARRRGGTTSARSRKVPRTPRPTKRHSDLPTSRNDSESASGKQRDTRTTALQRP